MDQLCTINHVKIKIPQKIHKKSFQSTRFNVLFSVVVLVEGDPLKIDIIDEHLWRGIKMNYNLSGSLRTIDDDSIN